MFLRPALLVALVLAGALTAGIFSYETTRSHIQSGTDATPPSKSGPGSSSVSSHDTTTSSSSRTGSSSNNNDNNSSGGSENNQQNAGSNNGSSSGVSDSNSRGIVSLKSKGSGWVKEYVASGGSSTELDVHIIGMVPASDGGYVGIAKVERSDGPVNLIFKIDNNGNIAWQNSFTYNVLDLFSLATASDGGYVASGWVQFIGNSCNVPCLSGVAKGIILKFDEHGKVSWTRTVDDSKESLALTVKQSSDNGYVVMSVNWLVKLNSEGQLEWQKSYGPITLRSLDIVKGHAGGYVLGGNVIATPHQPTRPVIVRLDDSGNVIWARTYTDSGSFEQFTDAVAIPDGQIVTVRDCDCKDSAQVVAKLASDGKILWEKSYSNKNNIGYSTFSNIQPVSDGYLLYGGASFEFTSLLKINGNGDIQWGRLVNVTLGSPWTSAVVPASNNELVIAGNHAHEYPYPSYRHYGPVWIYKLDSEGGCCGKSSFNYPFVTSSFTSQTSNIQVDAQNVQITLNTATTTSGTSSITVRDICNGPASVISGSTDNTDTNPTGSTSPGPGTWRETVYTIPHTAGQYEGDPATASAMVPASDGNGYVIVGSTATVQRYQSLSTISWMFKIDDAGKIVWQTGYNTSQTPFSLSTIAITTDAGYVAGGAYNSQNGLSPVIVKFDSQGHIVWMKKISLGQITWISKIIQTKDNGFLISGPSIDNYAKAWIGKLDTSGQIVWMRTYGSDTYRTSLSGFDNVDDNGYIVTGTNQYSDGTQTGVVLLLDKDGNILWQETLASKDGSATPSDVHYTSDGGFIIGGSSNALVTNALGISGHIPGAWLLKLDHDGRIIWQKAYASYNNTASITTVRETSDGYVLSGSAGAWTNSEYGSTPQTVLLKVDKQGNLELSRFLNVANPNVAVVTGNTGYVVAGNRAHGYSHEPWGGPIWIMKLDPSGNCCGNDNSYNSKMTSETTSATTGASQLSTRDIHGTIADVTIPASTNVTGNISLVCSS